MLVDYLLVSMVSQKKCTIELPFKFSFIKSIHIGSAKQLYCYFQHHQKPKCALQWQSQSYNFWLHSYSTQLFLVVHGKKKNKKKKKLFYLCVHTAFDYFTHFYSFFYSYFSSSTFTLLLFVRSHFIYSLFFFFFFILNSHCYILFVRSHYYCSFILIFFLFLYIVFLFVRSHCYCSRYIILL